jgi:beta-lactamase regulating signal transducer with metallopeptidase domain
MGENIYRIFDVVWKLSLVGGYCVLLVLLSRLLLKKAPKWCSYLLWGIVFVRLCCPVLPQTGISLIPERLLAVGTETMYGQSANGYGNNGVLPDVDPNGQSSWQQAGNLHAGTAGEISGAGLANGKNENVNVANAIDNESDANAFGTDGADGSQAAGNAADGGCLADNRDNADGSLQITGAENGSSGAAMEESVTDTNGTAVANTLYRPVGFRVIAMVWLFGMAGFMGYHTFSYLRMRNRLHRPDGGVRQVEPGICEIDGGHLSFVMGLIHPVIYLSSGLDPESRKVVLCHERVHLQRRDYLFKPAALVICCVHWFNPLVWLAFYLMNMDCEMSCDEKVVKLLGEESKKIYSYTLLEEASGGEWKRYRGGSICALLSFGEDHVKNRIRHVLDYRKPPFWVMIGAAAVIVVLVVCLCSNPGGSGNGAGTADRADTDNSAGVATDVDSNAETSGNIAQFPDSIKTPEDFAKVTIRNREDFAAVFDVEAIEEKHSFAADQVAYDLLVRENNTNAAYAIFKALAEEPSSETYRKYTDPVTAAVSLLHLGDGSGAVTETLYPAGRQYPYYREDSDRPGEGSVVNVHYTFADGSAVDIPMVMAEEMTQLWLLSFGDPGSAEDLGYGPLTGDICTRMVYGEYELRQPDRAVYWGWMDWYPVDAGSYSAYYPHVQISNYGIYTMSELWRTSGSVFRCIQAERIMATGWYDVTCERGAYDTSDAYTQLQKDLPDVTEWSGGKVYYLTDPDEAHLMTDEWMPRVLREFATDTVLPVDLQLNSDTTLHVHDGYYDIYNSNPSISMRFALSGADSQHIERADILAYPGVVFDVSERTETETSAQLDLDGDGVPEKISLHPAEPVTGYSFEEYKICVNLGLGQMNCYDLRDAVLEIDGQTIEIPDSTGNMSNSIFAFSPDGEQLLIALYDDGESADPLTRIYHYEDGKPVETDRLAQDLRKAWIQDGQMVITEPYFAVQNDYIQKIYQVTSNGRLREVPQEEYVLSAWEEVELRQDITLYRTPDGDETFVLPKGSKVRMTKLDATQDWICIEITDGVKGWFRLQDGKDYSDYFSGLYFAG